MIDNDRLKHILGVARVMSENAERLGLNKQEMFMLGMLHDIGYEFGEISEHNKIGGEILKRQNYKYYNEVFYHGILNPPYSSLELDLLNYADLHITKYGDYVTIEQRLEDIGSRWGFDSPYYLNPKKIAENLKSKDLFKRLMDKEK